MEEVKAAGDGSLCSGSTLFELYDASLRRRLPTLTDDYSRSLAGVSSDGASNMIGVENSVASRFHEKAPSALITHAVAHRIELCYNGAFAQIEYFTTITEHLNDVYSEFHGRSCKNILQLGDVATLINETILKYVQLHGIRWMASVLRALKVNSASGSRPSTRSHLTPQPKGLQSLSIDDST